MIYLTPSAEHHLQELLVARRAAAGQGVRLSSNGHGGVTIGVDDPQPGDTVISLVADRRLIVEPHVAAALDGRILDYLSVDVDGRTVGRFTLVPDRSMPAPPRRPAPARSPR